MDSIVLNPSPTPSAREVNPSRLLANFYLLIGIGMLFLSGRAVKGTLAQYLIGSIVEVILACLAIGCVKFSKLPVKQTMRLQWPGWETFFLAFFAAPGLWLSGVILNVISSTLLGYTTPTPPEMYPTNIAESIAFVFTAVVVAPICEELMFRGYIQRAYERGRPYAGILVGGIIFALYHMQFQGLFALLPVAIALGFVAWRSESVFPSMLLHAAYNLCATAILLTTTSLPYEFATAVFIILLIVSSVGCIVTALAFWVLWRGTDPRPLPQPVNKHGIHQWTWVIPLLLLALLYTYGSASEIIAGKYPQLLVAGTLDFEPPTAWHEPQSWEYEIQDILGNPIGESICNLHAVEQGYRLQCSGNQQSSNLFEKMPLEISWLSHKFDIETRDWEQEIFWNAENLSVVTLSGNESRGEQKSQWKMNADIPNRLYLETNAGSESVEFPPEALIDHEWPWRLSGLPLEMFYGGSIPIVTLDDKDNILIEQAFISVRSAEPAWTSAGAVIAWKVTVTYSDANGKEMTETAWYMIDPPHPLVRYDNGRVSFVLQEDNNWE